MQEDALRTNISVQEAYAMNGIQRLAYVIGPIAHLSFCQLLDLATFEHLAEVPNVLEGSDDVDKVIFKNALRQSHESFVLQGPNQPLKLWLV